MEDKYKKKDLPKSYEAMIADGQVGLGNIYSIGDGILHDNSKALNWYCRVDEQEHNNAQYMISSIYYHGNGFSRNYAKTVFWFHRTTDCVAPKIGELLKKVKDSISTYDKWCKYDMAQNKNGDIVPFLSSQADRFCIPSAIVKESLNDKEERRVIMCDSSWFMCSTFAEYHQVHVETITEKYPLPYDYLYWLIEKDDRPLAVYDIIISVIDRAIEIAEQRNE